MRAVIINRKAGHFVPPCRVANIKRKKIALERKEMVRSSSRSLFSVSVSFSLSLSASLPLCLSRGPLSSRTFSAEKSSARHDTRPVYVIININVACVSAESANRAHIPRARRAPLLVFSTLPIAHFALPRGQWNR